MIRSLLRIAPFILSICLTAGCEQIKEIPDDKFVGTWELTGRSMFNGIQIKIEKQDGKFKGKVIKLNDNKLVKMFAEVNDVWVSDISRKSVYEFTLTEKKLAKDLFSIYGMSTSTDFDVEFIDDNTIGLGTGVSSATNSSIQYKRIQ